MEEGGKPEGSGMIVWKDQKTAKKQAGAGKKEDEIKSLR